MAFFFLDDSKHNRFGFSLSSFVICNEDPTDQVASVFRDLGFDPLTFEFKSSAVMAGNENLQNLRAALKWFIATKCKIALCVVSRDDKKIGPASLQLLKAAMRHPWIMGDKHEIYFDEGLFSSARAANALVESDEAFDHCTFYLEQDSRAVLGIQLADAVAHTCATMLLEALGHVTKKITVDAPEDPIYHGLEIELGFEMWADIRYTFLCQNKPHPKDKFESAVVDVFPWGLFVDDTVPEVIKAAAMSRFGQMYLGCIH